MPEFDVEILKDVVVVDAKVGRRHFGKRLVAERRHVGSGDLLKLLLVGQLLEFGTARLCWC